MSKTFFQKIITQTSRRGVKDTNFWVRSDNCVQDYLPMMQQPTFYYKATLKKTDDEYYLEERPMYFNINFANSFNIPFDQIVFPFIFNQRKPDRTAKVSTPIQLWNEFAGNACVTELDNKLYVGYYPNTLYDITENRVLFLITQRYVPHSTEIKNIINFDASIFINTDKMSKFLKKFYLYVKSTPQKYTRWDDTQVITTAHVWEQIPNIGYPTYDWFDLNTHTTKEIKEKLLSRLKNV